MMTQKITFDPETQKDVQNLMRVQKECGEKIQLICLTYLRSKRVKKNFNLLPDGSGMVEQTDETSRTG